MLRIFDIFFSLFGLVFGLPLFLLIYLIILLTSGSPLFIQKRVGRHQVSFKLVKFRTMDVKTASTPTHLADSSNITKVGSILRKTKLDELPQLWNVFKGDMSLVGPRPCLLSQHTLIKERSKLNIFDVRPGITGLAQIRSIDMSNPSKLVAVEFEMIKHYTSQKYFLYILSTIIGHGGGDRVVR